MGDTTTRDTERAACQHEGASELLDRLASIVGAELAPQTADRALRVQLHSLGAVLANIAAELRTHIETPEEADPMTVAESQGLKAALDAAKNAAAQARARTVPINWKITSDGGA